MAHAGPYPTGAHTASKGTDSCRCVYSAGLQGHAMSDIEGVEIGACTSHEMVQLARHVLCPIHRHFLRVW